MVDEVQVEGDHDWLQKPLQPFRKTNIAMRQGGGGEDGQRVAHHDHYGNIQHQHH